MQCVLIIILYILLIEKTSLDLDVLSDSCNISWCFAEALGPNATANTNGSPYEFFPRLQIASSFHLSQNPWNQGPGVAAPMSFPCSHLKSWCIFVARKLDTSFRRRSETPQGATPVGMRWRKFMHDRSKAKSFVPFVDDFVADVN